MMLLHKGTETLETERIILRKFNFEDLNDMYTNWASDDEVTRYLTWPTHENRETTFKILDSWISKYSEQEYYQWAITLKEYGKVIGSISLMNINNENKSCEIGYCIGRNYWNKGITTEAFKQLIEFAFMKIGFKKIIGKHFIENIASGRVMQKCGMGYVGILEKAIVNSKGHLCDCKEYSITLNDYLNKIQ